MKRKWWTLVAVSVATFMLLLDITVVNVAPPSIREDLGASFALGAFSPIASSTRAPQSSASDRGS